MKTNLLSAVMLFEAIMKLSETPMDFASAHSLVMTKNELAPHVSFFAEKEDALLEKYSDKNEEGKAISDGGGHYRISRENVGKFTEERNQLNAVEVEITKRKLASVPKTITPAVLETLLSAFEFPESEVDDIGG